MHITVASQDYPSEHLTIGNELSPELKNKLINKYDSNNYFKEAIG